MSKLLVTGGAGFIGSNFIHYWLQKYPQDQITNLDKLTYAGNLGNLKTIEKNPNYRFLQGDIVNAKIVDEAMQGIDIVVHFAAETHVDRSIMNPSPFISTNINGTAILLQAALKHQVKRFHHISTDEVFGHLPLNTQDRFDENTPYQPRSPYSASKAAADHLVRAYYYTYQLPITISNCSNNFGPFHFPEKFIPLAITNLLEGKKIPIYGDGQYVRDWLYVKDHCRAIDLILHKGKVGETYLVGGQTQNFSNLEIIKMILKLMNKTETEIEMVKDRPGHDRRYSINWEKIKRELNWEPQYSFEQALKLTIDWYQKHQSWWMRIKSGQYRQYYQQQYGL